MWVPVLTLNALCRQFEMIENVKKDKIKIFLWPEKNGEIWKSFVGGRKRLFCSLLIKKAGEMSGNTFLAYGLTITKLLLTTAVQRHGTM